MYSVASIDEKSSSFGTDTITDSKSQSIDIGVDDDDDDDGTVTRDSMAHRVHVTNLDKSSARHSKIKTISDKSSSFEHG